MKKNMPESDKILQLEHLSSHYIHRKSGFLGGNERKDILKDVSFSIRRGETFGLVGESGCGKSTLARAIIGLIPSAGRITIDGENVLQKRTKEQHKKVQIVFQDPLSSLNPTKKIGWILEEPLRIHRIGDRASRLRRVNEVLELVGLDTAFRDRYPSELSGGQRQRVSIGEALMLRPKLIVADEPVSALDVSVQSQILNLMGDLRNRLDLSYLFISHNLNVVYYLCDRTAVMYMGQIVELADVQTLFDLPAHPYTQMLLSAIPEIGSEPEEAQENNILSKALDREPSKTGCVFFARCPNACEKCKETSPELVNIGDESGKQHFVRCHCLAHSTGSQ